MVGGIGRLRSFQPYDVCRHDHGAARAKAGEVYGRTSLKLRGWAPGKRETRIHHSVRTGSIAIQNIKT
jgi:hypothetical protein